MLALSHELMPLPRSTAIEVGGLVLVAFLVEGIWRLARHITVIAHEGAHAVAGWGVGRKVQGMKLNSNATGATTTFGRDRGLGLTIVGFAGYLGPSICGLIGAGLIALGHIAAVLWLAVIFLVLMLLLVRNTFGVISVALNGGILYLVLRYGSAGLQTVAAYGLSWLMLLSGVRGVVSHNINAGDASILRDQTRIPRFVWFVLWLVPTVAALWFGGRLLLM